MTELHDAVPEDPTPMTEADWSLVRPWHIDLTDLDAPMLEVDARRLRELVRQRDSLQRELLATRRAFSVTEDHPNWGEVRAALARGADEG